MKFDSTNNSKTAEKSNVRACEERDRDGGIGVRSPSANPFVALFLTPCADVAPL